MSSEREYAVAKANYENLISDTPINAMSLLESLRRVMHEGEAAAQADEIGTVRFANETTALFTGALALNEAGKVQPPLTAKNIHDMHQQIERLSVFTQGNEETGPTNIADRPTTAKK